MFPIRQVTGFDVAFGPDSIVGMIPPYKDIPEEFRRGHTPWNELFSTLFYSGGSVGHLRPKPGVEKAKAIAHIRAVMGSFEPKHEHKEAGVAFLFSEWFEPIGESEKVQP